MSKNLTKSDIHRRNILNNKYALLEIEKEIAFPGIPFESTLKYTKKQIADFYKIDNRTIERYLEQYKNELSENGYEVIDGKRLKDFKDVIAKYYENNNDVTDIDVGDIVKAPKLGIFDFRAFLNIGMLLTESERAKQLRALVLDIVIDTLNAKIGGATKYVNQREDEFLPSAIREYNYRQAFTDALDSFIVDNKWKFAQFTDAVYKSIFHENAKEYKQILKLKASDSARDTMYSEVLDLIAAYENGFADFLQRKYETINRKLTLPEATRLFSEFEFNNQAMLKPLLEKARTLMASRDMAFRDALHEKLKNYVTHLTAQEFDKFLGEKSMALEERLKKNIDVFKRLKNR
ncbi:DNA-binding protein [Flavobacteriaceae bacterium M23B6Z8]